MDVKLLTQQQYVSELKETLRNLYHVAVSSFVANFVITLLYCYGFFLADGFRAIGGILIFIWVQLATNASWYLLVKPHQLMVRSRHTILRELKVKISTETPMVDYLRKYTQLLWLSDLRIPIFLQLICFFIAALMIYSL